MPVDHPFCPEIAFSVGAEIVTGYPDGTFRPTTVVSRQAMAAVLARTLLPMEPSECRGDVFTDVTADNPFCSEIEFLADSNVVTGYGDGGFHPTAPVTRQAIVAVLARMTLR